MQRFRAEIKPIRPGQRAKLDEVSPKEVWIPQRLRHRRTRLRVAREVIHTPRPIGKPQQQFASASRLDSDQLNHRPIHTRFLTCPKPRNGTIPTPRSALEVVPACSEVRGAWCTKVSRPPAKPQEERCFGDAG